MASKTKTKTSATATASSATPTAKVSADRKRLLSILSGRSVAKSPTTQSKKKETKDELSSIRTLPDLPPDKSVISPKPKMVQKRVTSAMAEVWLRSAAKNRKLDGREVRKYADIMINGRWEDYHPQGWVFSTEGRMLEGQHRAAAVIKAAEVLGEDFNIGVCLMLGFDIKTQETIDTGRSRTMAQTAEIVDLGASAFEIQITKALWISPENPKKPRVTNYQEVFDAFSEYQDGIKFSAQKFNGGRSLSLAAVRAVIARAYYSCQDADDIADLKRFIEVMDTGLPASEDEHQPALLREAYLNRKSRGERETLELYRKAVTAVGAYMKNDKIVRLRQTRQQLFPLEKFDAKHCE